MQGNERIHELLGDLLANELAAVNTYFVHAKMQENWGYRRLAKRTYDESLTEMRHAEELVDRMLFFDWVPNLQRLGRVRAGGDFVEQLRIELDLEVSTRDLLIPGIDLARREGDDGTRLVLEPMLREGEEGIDWLETQLGLVESLGETAYLAEQLQE